MSVAVEQRRDSVARPPGRRRPCYAVLAICCGPTAGRPLTWGAGIGAMSALIAALWPSIEGSVSKLVESTRRR